MSLRLKRTIAGAFFAATLNISLGALPASAGTEQPMFVSVGENTRAPIGWVEFCTEQPAECASSSTAPRDVMLSSKT